MKTCDKCGKEVHETIHTVYLEKTATVFYYTRQELHTFREVTGVGADGQKTKIKVNGFKVTDLLCTECFAEIDFDWSKWVEK